MHIAGHFNPSDIFTKYLGWHKFWPRIQPLLLWKGETHADYGTQLIAVTIQEIKSYDSKDNPPSGLRGLTEYINPSDGERWVVVTNKKKKNTKDVG